MGASCRGQLPRRPRPEGLPPRPRRDSAHLVSPSQSGTGGLRPRGSTADARPPGGQTTARTECSAHGRCLTNRTGSQALLPLVSQTRDSEPGRQLASGPADRRGRAWRGADPAGCGHQGPFSSATANSRGTDFHGADPESPGDARPPTSPPRTRGSSSSKTIQTFANLVPSSVFTRTPGS